MFVPQAVTGFGCRYAGFNLVVGDISVGSASAYYVTNHPSSQVLAHGIPRGNLSLAVRYPTPQAMPTGAEQRALRVAARQSDRRHASLKSDRHGERHVERQRQRSFDPPG